MSCGYHISMAALTASLARRALRQFSSPERATFVARFFRTGEGEYGEGDVFIGASVPECRSVAREFREFSFVELEKLLMSRVHEERLVALIILGARFSREPEAVFRRASSLFFASVHPSKEALSRRAAWSRLHRGVGAARVLGGCSGTAAKNSVHASRLASKHPVSMTSLPTPENAHVTDPSSAPICWGCFRSFPRCLNRENSSQVFERVEGGDSRVERTWEGRHQCRMH